MLDFSPQCKQILNKPHAFSLEILRHSSDESGWAQFLQPWGILHCPHRQATRGHQAELLQRRGSTKASQRKGTRSKFHSASWGYLPRWDSHLEAEASRGSHLEPHDLLTQIEGRGATALRAPARGHPSSREPGRARWRTGRSRNYSSGAPLPCTEKCLEESCEPRRSPRTQLRPDPLPYGISISTFLQNFHVIFYNVRTNLHSYLQF